MATVTNQVQNAPYVYELTGLPYNGMVVEINDELFSTQDGTLEGNSQKVIVNDTTTETITQTGQDVITTFLVGDSSQFGRLRFFTDKNNPNSQIAINTPLHHHTIPASGDNNFMTQHNMNGAVSVFSQNQVNFNIQSGGVGTTNQSQQNGQITGGPSNQQAGTTMGGGSY